MIRREVVVRTGDLFPLCVEALRNVVRFIALLGGLRSTHPQPLLDHRAVERFLHALTKAIVDESGDIPSLGDGHYPIDGVVPVDFSRTIVDHVSV